MKYSSIIFSAMLLSGASVLLSSCSSEASEQEISQQNQQPGQNPKAESVYSDWPETSRNVAKKIVNKYGQPDEMTDTRLIWFETGPWKRTIVYKEEVPHHFPKKHVDVLEQTIDYQLPIDKYDDITAYDGSVFAERTKGELSARCDMEAANFLAINLAHDVATGKKSVKAARQEYAKTVMALMEGKKPDYTKGFAFTLPKGDQTDPDQAVLDQQTARK